MYPDLYLNLIYKFDCITISIFNTPIILLYITIITTTIILTPILILNITPTTYLFLFTIIIKLLLLYNFL